MNGWNRATQVLLIAAHQFPLLADYIVSLPNMESQAFNLSRNLGRTILYFQTHKMLR